MRAVHVGLMAGSNGTIGRDLPTQDVHCIMQTKAGEVHSQNEVVLHISSASCKRDKTAFVVPRSSLGACTPSLIWPPVSFLEMDRSAL